MRRNDPFLEGAFPLARRIAFINYAGELRRKIPSNLRKNTALFDVQSLEAYLQSSTSAAEGHASFRYIQEVIAECIWGKNCKTWKSQWDFIVELNAKQLFANPAPLPKIEIYPGPGYPLVYKYMAPVYGKETNAFVSIMLNNFEDFLEHSFLLPGRMQTLLDKIVADSEGVRSHLEKKTNILIGESEDEIRTPLDLLSQLIGYVSIDPKWDTLDVYKKNAPDPTELWRGETKKPANYKQRVLEFDHERGFFQEHVTTFQKELGDLLEYSELRMAAASLESWRFVGTLAEFLYEHPGANYIFVSPHLRNQANAINTDLPYDENEWPIIALSHWIRTIINIRNKQFGIPSVGSLLLKDPVPQSGRIAISLLPLSLEAFANKQRLRFKNDDVSLNWNPSTQEFELQRGFRQSSSLHTVKIKAHSLLSHGILFRDSEWLKRNKFLTALGRAAWKYEERIKPTKKPPRKKRGGMGDCGEKLG